MAKSIVSATSLFDTMQKVETAKENVKQEEKEKKPTASIKEVDDVKKTEVIKNMSDAEPANEIPISKDGVLGLIKKNTRELKKIHKTFLITESMDKKFKALAKNCNMSENEFFCQIIEKIL